MKNAFLTPLTMSQRVLSIKESNFNAKIGQNVHCSHLLTVRAKGADPPSPPLPYGQPALPSFAVIMGPQKGNPTSQIETICCFIT